MALDPLSPGQVPPPVYRPKSRAVEQPAFRLPQPVPSAPTHLTFESATRAFGESIQALSQPDRKEIQIIHQAVDQWAAQNPGSDRFGQFVFRVMDYSHKRLEQLEKLPQAEQSDCQGLERVFLNGYQMIEVYSAL